MVGRAGVAVSLVAAVAADARPSPPSRLCDSPRERRRPSGRRAWAPPWPHRRRLTEPSRRTPNPPPRAEGHTCRQGHQQRAPPCTKNAVRQVCRAEASIGTTSVWPEPDYSGDPHRVNRENGRLRRK
jgi:hypothetical protein